MSPFLLREASGWEGRCGALIPAVRNSPIFPSYTCWPQPGPLCVMELTALPQLVLHPASTDQTALWTKILNSCLSEAWTVIISRHG